MISCFQKMNNTTKINQIGKLLSFDIPALNILKIAKGSTRLKLSKNSIRLASDPWVRGSIDGHELN